MSVAEVVEQYILRRHFAAGSRAGIAATESLFALDVLDSLAFIDLILFIEQEFGVTLDDADVSVENFETLAAIADLVGRAERTALPPVE
jgi:acyl carrier protein